MKAKRFFKIVNTDGHRGMSYKNGVNEDIVPFNEAPTCGSGGLYFTDLHNILNFVDYGTQLYEVVPLGKVVKVNDKYKAHALNMTFICEGHLEIVKYLVDNGADVHANDDEALRWAASNGYLEVVEYLVDNGADIHANNDGALMWATLNGRLEVVKYLVENGADIHADDDWTLRAATGNVKEYFHNLTNK